MPGRRARSGVLAMVRLRRTGVIACVLARVAVRLGNYRSEFRTGSPVAFGETPHGTRSRGGLHFGMPRKDATPSNSQKSPATPRLRAVTREQIAALAHAIWVDRGRPEGSDMDIWLEAERQLQAKATPQPLSDHEIPADPASAGDPDQDPALRPDIDRQLDSMTPKREQRSPTSI